jgi:hypothetical protein
MLILYLASWLLNLHVEYNFIELNWTELCITLTISIFSLNMLLSLFSIRLFLILYKNYLKQFFSFSCYFQLRCETVYLASLNNLEL